VNPFRLDNQVALITGGGSGIGKGIARCMTAAGARVALVGRRGDVLAQACGELGPQAVPFTHDVLDTEAAPALVDRISREMGEPTILVNNAGIHLKKGALETHEAEFRRVMETHVVGAMALSRAAGSRMVAAGGGSILFTSSMAAVFGIPNVSAYSAAKSAMLGLVRSLAVELSPHGVRVNAIAPGWIDSDMMRGALDKDPARKERILTRTPMQMFGAPEDIGWAAVYFCSPAAKFVTGQHLAVDGGVSIGF